MGWGEDGLKEPPNPPPPAPASTPGRQIEVDSPGGLNRPILCGVRDFADRAAMVTATSPESGVRMP